MSCGPRLVLPREGCDWIKGRAVPWRIERQGRRYSLTYGGKVRICNALSVHNFLRHTPS